MRIPNVVWLSVVVMLGFLLKGTQVGSAATGYEALDEASIAVKSPQQTSFVAITRAGQALVAVGVHGVIIVSDDSGKTWRQAKVPVDVTLTDLYFKTDQEGWAVGHYGVILHTADGGLTWQTVVTGLDVINAMVAVKQQLQASSPASDVTATQTKVANYFENQGPDQPFLAIGPCGGGILAIGAKDMAMFSADNGKTWSDWTPHIDNPTFRMLYDILTLDNKPVLVGETGFTAVGDAACSQIKPAPTSALPTLYGALPLSDGAMLVYGLQGTVARSSDFGVNWQPVQIATQSIIDAGLVLKSGKVLLGTLDGQLYLSADDGHTFHQIAAQIPFQIAAVVDAPDGSIVIAGNGGVAVLPAAEIN